MYTHIVQMCAQLGSTEWNPIMRTKHGKQLWTTGGQMSLDNPDSSDISLKLESNLSFIHYSFSHSSLVATYWASFLVLTSSSYEQWKMYSQPGSIGKLLFIVYCDFDCLFCCWLLYALQYEH